MKIFKTHSNRCYLLHERYLVYNLPMAEIEVCLEHLKRGELYNKCAKYIIHSIFKDFKSGYEEVYNSRRYDDIEGPVLTLIIDDKFNMTYKLKNKTVIITDGRETIHSKYPDLFAWTGAYLDDLGYCQYALDDGKKLMYLKNGLYDSWVATQNPL